jgi:hypothetical protein
MFFAGPVLPMGSVLLFSVELPGLETMDVTGEVRHHQHAPATPGMGIRFTRLTQKNVEVIRLFLSRAPA